MYKNICILSDGPHLPNPYFFPISSSCDVVLPIMPWSLPLHWTRDCCVTLLQ